MLSQYFAQYLLNHRILTAEQVREVLEEEQEHRVKLGVLAISQGMMDAWQVEMVHQLQVRFDRRFGEVAVNEGFLTDVQLEELISMQESSNLNIGQAILNKKFMTLEQLEKALKDYNGDNKLAIDDALYKEELLKIDFADNSDMKDLYSEYASLFLRCLMRLIDTKGIIVSERKQAAEKPNWLISQRMVGEVGITSGMLISEPVLIEMARRYSGEDITEADALAVDSVAEFLNVTNGLFVVNLSNRYLDIDLEAQKCGKNIVPLGHKQVTIPIQTPFGEICLIIAADAIQ